MKFKKGEYYVCNDELLRYNSKDSSNRYGNFLKFYNVKMRKLELIPEAYGYYVVPATKLDLLLRGLDENIRIPSSKTASTGKR
jgi:hypothetical protein